MDNLFETSRRAAGLTAKAAAEAVGLSRPTFTERERDPGTYRLQEIKALLGKLDEEGASIMRRAVLGYLEL